MSVGGVTMFQTGFNPRLPGGRRRRGEFVFRVRVGFNPRLPGGRRPVSTSTASPSPVFQSTPSGGKATPERDRRPALGDVSIHAFRGEGDARRQPLALLICVSIHAFRGEGDGSAAWILASPPVFQSTPSGGKATLTGFRCCSRGGCFNPRLPGGRRHAASAAEEYFVVVSIHAFRGEGDSTTRTVYHARAVSIHAFRGEGDSTQSDWRRSFAVSIHAFRGEGDAPLGAVRKKRGCFNPRLPGGRRRASASVSISSGFVSIHAFRGEGDRYGYCGKCRSQKFQSTPSGGKATQYA